VAALLGLPAREALDDATSTMRFQVEEIKEAHATGAPLDPADLLMGDNDILEKTLVTEEPKAPEDRYPTAPAPEMPAAEERTASGTEPPSDGRTTGSYKSAKDAISQLFGDAPAPGPKLVRQTTTKSAFELDATLEALENTLGGTPLAEAAEAKEAATTPPSAPLQMEELPASSTATQRMSLADLQAAMAAMAPAEEAPAQPAPVPEPAAKELDAMEVTQMVDASRLARQAPDPAATNPVGAMIPAPTGGATSDDPNLLRLKIGDDIYPNLAMDQLTRWVEEGRVLENHLVARQFSENWIEAHKVPGLRPVFERLKRLREGAPSLSLEGTAPVKKSLFGGLFGKKD
jgi:hypothetical protein